MVYLFDSSLGRISSWVRFRLSAPIFIEFSLIFTHFQEYFHIYRREKILRNFFLGWHAQSAGVRQRSGV